MTSEFNHTTWKAGFVDNNGFMSFDHTGRCHFFWRFSDSGNKIEKVRDLAEILGATYTNGQYSVRGQNFLSLFDEIKDFAPYRRRSFGGFLSWWLEAEKEEKQQVYRAYSDSRKWKPNYMLYDELSITSYKDLICDPSFVAGAVEANMGYYVDDKGTGRRVFRLTSVNKSLIMALHARYLGSVSFESKTSARLTLGIRDLSKFRDEVGPYLQLRNIDED